MLAFLLENSYEPIKILFMGENVQITAFFHNIWIVSNSLSLFWKLIALLPKLETLFRRKTEKKLIAPDIQCFGLFPTVYENQKGNC